MGVSDAIDISQHNKKIIHELLEQHLPNTTVWVYGSRIKGTARPNSDLDMVAFIKKEQSASFDDLKEAFDESDLPFRVDLFRWDEIPDQFHQNIKSDYVVLQDEVGSSDGWVDDSLGNVLEIKYGKDHKKLPDGDIPCYGTGGIMRKVDSSLYDQESILIPRKGSLNNIYFVDKPFWTVDTLFWTKIDKSLIDPKFMFYQLKLTDFTSLNVGSAVPSLTVPVLNDLKIKYPSLPEQKAIAHILGSLDDKIELNRQMNETLESMAQALFKSWFVDFDPVIDNALAAGNPIPDVFAERAKQRSSAGSLRLGSGRADDGASDDVLSVHPELVEGFPSEFEFTEEMGWIPKGWKGGQLSKHALIEMGQSPKGDTYNSCSEGMPLVNGPVEFGPYFTNKSKWTTSPIKVSQEGDLVVCVRGSTTGRFVKSDDQYCLGRGVCSIRAKQSQCFVDQLFKLSIDQLLVLATGSTFPNWSKKTLTDFTVIIPPQTIISIFDGFVSPLVDRIESGFIESSSLTKLRDTLLPKLLSGKLRIPEAEKMINEAQA